MQILNAQYTSEDNDIIRADIDGIESYIPVTLNNRHYKEIIDNNITIDSYTPEA